jgi:mycoredoxin
LRYIAPLLTPPQADGVLKIIINNISYNYIDIEIQPDEVVRKVIEVNGGFDWVVPTLEYNGIWREGKVFNENELILDLKKMGIGGHSD